MISARPTCATDRGSVSLPGMTTATRPRKLRLYSPDLSDSYVSRDVTRMLALAQGRVQAPYYIAAATKAEAVKYAQAAGFWARSATLRMERREQGSNSLNAVLDAGYLTEPGEILVWTERGGVENVRNVVQVKVNGAVSVANIVGQWTYVERINADHEPRRSATFLIRLADGARFPERPFTKPATPSTGWTGEQA